MGNFQLKAKKHESENVISESMINNDGSLYVSNNSFEKEDNNSKYLFYEEMDEPNKKMMDVLESNGPKELISAITQEMKEKKMSYAEMRTKYG